MAVENALFALDLISGELPDTLRPSRPIPVFYGHSAYFTATVNLTQAPGLVVFSEN